MITKISKSILLLFILFSLNGCDIFDAAVERAVEQTQTRKETSNTPSPSKKQPTSTINPSPTIKSSPTTKTCISANFVTIDQIGKILEVCGEITYAGDAPCPNCPNGYYAYLVVDESFYILSYDWVFSSAWIGDCIMVKDTVEPFGSKPAFVFGKQEGYDGSKCEYLSDGTLSCREGEYFKMFNGCN